MTKKGLDLINKLGFGAVLVDASRKVRVTENLKDKIELLDKRYEMH